MPAVRASLDEPHPLRVVVHVYERFDQVAVFTKHTFVTLPTLSQHLMGISARMTRATDLLWLDVAPTAPPRPQTCRGANDAGGMLLNQAMALLQSVLLLPVASVQSVLSRPPLRTRVHHARGTLYCCLPVPRLVALGGTSRGVAQRTRFREPARDPKDPSPTRDISLHGYSSDEYIFGAEHTMPDTSRALHEALAHSDLATGLHERWAHTHLFLRKSLLITVVLPTAAHQVAVHTLHHAPLSSARPTTSSSVWSVQAARHHVVAGHGMLEGGAVGETSPTGTTAHLVFHAVLEHVLAMPDALINQYRTAVQRYDARTFDITHRSRTGSDVHQAMQLYLMARELGILKERLLPSARVLDTLLGLPSTALHAEIIDYLEEVRDACVAQLLDIDLLRDEAQALVGLLFDLRAARSTVAQQALAGVSVLFVPLTWWAGIYGTNFSILPELAWGVDGGREMIQPAGWAAGYLFFWMGMLTIAACSMIALRWTRVF